MSNFIIEDFKKAWNKPENGLIKIILITILVSAIFGIIYTFIFGSSIENIVRNNINKQLKKLKSKAKGGYLVIIGAGGVGLAAVKIVKAMMQTKIVVLDINPLKLQAAAAAGARAQRFFSGGKAQRLFNSMGQPKKNLF